MFEFVNPRLDQFWHFVYERQSIWQRRFVERLAPPWTSDKILATYRFTNVYRELDPGTKYAIDKILELDESKPDKVFNVMIYRLIGKSDTHAAIGFQRLATFDPKKMEETLRKIKKADGHPFTGAYMVGGYSKMGSSDKTTNISRLFSKLHDRFDDFYKKLYDSGSPKEAYFAIKSIYGFGNFLSYQILVDLTYPLKVYNDKALLPLSCDDWAVAGPGAKRGINILVPDKDVQDLAVMKWLNGNQTNEFKRLGLDFPYLKRFDGSNIPISLPNIQNCLCEYHKYVKIENGTGRARRRYKFL